MRQMFLDLRSLVVVPNHWGPVYHVQDEDGYEFLPAKQDTFWSVEDAAEWCKKHGREVRVPESTILAWASWTTAQMEEYRRRVEEARLLRRCG